MSLFSLFWHPKSNTVTVQPAGTPAPADADKLGDHDHPEDKNIREPHNGRSLFQIVRELLHPHGVVNLQPVAIQIADPAGAPDVNPASVAAPVQVTGKASVTVTTAPASTPAAPAVTVTDAVPTPAATQVETAKPAQDSSNASAEKAEPAAVAA